MIVFFSGGSPIPEVNLDHPTIMLSYYVNVGETGRPDRRLRKAMVYRRKVGLKGQKALRRRK